MAGFEPALSCSRSRRIGQAFPHPESDRSAQRESNPRVRHGKAVGCRYIMGTVTVPRIVKEPRAPGGTRTHVAALRVRCPRRWTTSACNGVGPEGLEPSPNRLRAGRSAARTSVPKGIASRPGRSRTSTARLSAECSPVELQAVCPRPRRSASRHGAGGIRTPADRLKRPTCCRYTTTPGGTPRAGACVWSRSSPRSAFRVQSVSQGGRIRTGGLKLPGLAD